MDADALPAEVAQREARLSIAACGYHRASEAMDQAREALYAAVRASVGAGMSKYRAAQVTGLSESMVTKIVRR